MTPGAGLPPPCGNTTIILSENARAIKAKLHVEHFEGGTKVYMNSPGHMTKMAAMAINSRNL